MDKNATYEEIFRLRISDFDHNDHLLPHAILDLAQDVAGKHADILNIGFNDFMKMNRIWVLVRNRYVMEKYPSLYEKVKVRTWPRLKGRADFDRDTLILNEDDEVICKVQSKWVILDVDKRTIVLPRHFEYPLKEICQDVTFSTPFNKLEDFPIDNLSHYEIQTEYCDLDHNRHINNIQYAKYIMNTLRLGDDELIHSFEIDYIHELSYGERVDLYWYKEDNTYHIKGVTNVVHFIARIEVEKR